MEDITTMSMDEYKRHVRNDNRWGLDPPKIPTTTKFELPGHILGMLQDLPFYGKEYEDAFEHIEEVVEISNYFHIPNVSKDAVMLRLLPVTLKGEAKEWLRSLPIGAITTWADFKIEFINQFIPPSKVAKLKRNIQNFQQFEGESLYEAWESYKKLLRHCPQHDFNVQQEISIFYDGVNMCTRQLLDSQGPMTRKDSVTNKALIEEFAKHSREYHNPKGDFTKEKSNKNGGQDVISAVVAKLDAMEEKITKMGESIQDRCRACRGPHSTRDCELEYRRDRDTKELHQIKHDLYNIEQVQSEKIYALESILCRFMEASEKRYDATYAILRVQKESILSIYMQVEELTKLVQEKLLESPDSSSRKVKT